MQEPNFVPQRLSLRDQLRQEIRSRIIRGRIPAGSRIVELDLAAELQVSRTPLREALIALEQEGFLEASTGRGFTVQPLTEQGYDELREIIAALERLALSQSPRPSGRELADLRTLNDELRATGTLPENEQSERRLQVDMLFHETLLANCPNKMLLGLISQLKRQWRRYEYAFWSLMTDVRKSAGQHDRVLDALAAGDAETAAQRLGENWLTWDRKTAGWTRDASPNP